MLNIFINTDKTVEDGDVRKLGYVSNVTGYFDANYEIDWFDDAFIRRIIKEVDNSEVIGENKTQTMYNEIIGHFPPMMLSSGCKCLILLYKEDIKINGDRLGDNCLNLMLEISRMKDITIALGHIPPFEQDFDAYIVNTDSYIHSFKEYVDARIDLL
jgi:hypothetical protein